MRVSRSTLVLAAVVAAEVLALVLFGPSADAEREIGALFPRFEAGRAERIVLSRARDGEPALRTVLARRARSTGSTGSEGGWELPERYDHPAREVAVRRLLDALGSLSNVDLLTDDPAQHARYGVGPEGLAIAVHGPGGEPLAEIVQGHAAPAATAAAGGASYVRALGSDAVYRAPRWPPVSPASRDWLDTRFLDFEPALVQEITLDLGARRARLVREDLGRWSAQGQPVSSRAVRALLERLDALFFDELLGPAPGELDPPDIEIVLHLHDGRELSLRFGEPDAAGARSATRGAGGPLVRFSPERAELVMAALESIAEELP